MARVPERFNITFFETKFFRTTYTECMYHPLNSSCGQLKEPKNNIEQRSSNYGPRTTCGPKGLPL